MDDGTMCVCVSKNSQLPISKTQVFISDQDNLQLEFYEGDRLYVRDNNFIYIINTNISTGSKISVTTNVNNQGHCTITVNGMLQGQFYIDVSENKVKNDDDLDTILLDSELFEKQVLINDILQLYKTFNKSCDLDKLQHLSIIDLRQIIGEFKFR